MESQAPGSSSFGDVGGDAEAFERFWEGCAPPCRRFLGRAFGHLRSIAPDSFDEIMEDAVRMAFIQARARWCTYKPERASVQTWVNRIAHNQFHHGWWSLQHWLQKRAALEEGAGVALADVADQVTVQTAVREAFQNLPVRQAQAVYLHHGEGLSTNEVARRLGTTAMGAESLLKRGRQGFQRHWRGPDERRTQP